LLEEEKRGEEEAVAPGAEDSVQEAITGRKKKSSSKKSTPAPKAKANSSAAPTRPASPVESVPADVEDRTVTAAKTVDLEQAKEAVPEERPASPPAKAPESSPASLLSDLRTTSSLLSTCLDTFFRPLAQVNAAYKQSQAITPLDLAVGRSLKRNPDVNILPEQVRSMLTNQHALRYGGEDGRVWSRGCVSPGGAHLRHLEQELEDRYIELEKSLRSLPAPLSFHAAPNARLPNSGGAGVTVSAEFPRFDLEALKRGYESGAARGRDANAMEKAVEEGSKKGSFLVGNAEQYINEFVMPVGSSGVAAGAAAAATKAGSSTRDIGITPQQAVAGAGSAGVVTENSGGGTRGVEELERSLAEAKRFMEDKEGQLRKLIKRNRKAMGLTH